MEKSEGPILLQRHGASPDIVHIILNRPKTLNAMNVVLLESLLATLRDV